MADISKIGSSECYKSVIEGTAPEVKIEVQENVPILDTEGNEIGRQNIHKPVQNKYSTEDLLKIVIDKLNEVIDKVNG